MVQVTCLTTDIGETSTATLFDLDHPGGRRHGGEAVWYVGEVADLIEACLTKAATAT